MSNFSFTKKIIFNSKMVRKVHSFQPQPEKRMSYRIKRGKERLSGCFVPHIKLY